MICDVVPTRFWAFLSIGCWHSSSWLDNEEVTMGTSPCPYDGRISRLAILLLLPSRKTSIVLQYSWRIIAFGRRTIQNCRHPLNFSSMQITKIESAITSTTSIFKIPGCMTGAPPQARKRLVLASCTCISFVLAVLKSTSFYCSDDISWMAVPLFGPFL